MFVIRWEELAVGVSVKMEVMPCFYRLRVKGVNNSFESSCTCFQLSLLSELFPAVSALPPPPIALHQNDKFQVGTGAAL